MIRAMQEKKKDSYNPLGICERLFNFIMNGIIASGFKRVTLGQPAGSAVEHQSNSPSKLNGEVMPVHYLEEPEGLESWTPVGDEFGSSIYEPHQKEDAVLQSGKFTSSSSTTTTTPVKHQEPKDKASETPRVKEFQGKSFPDIEPNRIPVAQPRGLKIKEAKESTEDQGEKSRKKGKKISSSSRNQLTLDEEIIKPTSTPSPRTVRSILGNNINEISDAYIRDRKEAMSRNQ